MTNHSSIQFLYHGLIVSCQAPIDSPLHDPYAIAAMAQAAVNNGAVGVRIDTPSHILLSPATSYSADHWVVEASYIRI